MANEISNRLDVYRILLTFFVVGIHTNYAGDPSNFSRFATCISLDVLYRTAVPGFFILTGFLILDKADFTWEYIQRRVNRILIPWALWSFIYLLFRVLFQDNQISLLSAIRCFFTGDTYYHLWFMYKLVGLYLIAPVYGIFVRSAGVQKAIIFALLAFLINILTPDLGNALSSIFKFSFQPAINMMGVDNLLVLAVTGWIIQRLNPVPYTKWFSLAVFLSCYTILLYITLSRSIELTKHTESAYYASLVSPMAVSFFIVAISFFPSKIPPKYSKPLADASFGIYLAHPLIIDLMRLLQIPLPQNIPLASTTIVFFITAAAIIATRRIPAINRLT